MQITYIPQNLLRLVGIIFEKQIPTSRVFHYSCGRTALKLKLGQNVTTWLNRAKRGLSERRLQKRTFCLSSAHRDNQSHMENAIFGSHVNHFVPLIIYIIWLCSCCCPAGLCFVHMQNSFQYYSTVTDEDINIHVESALGWCIPCPTSLKTALHPPPSSAQQRGKSLSQVKPLYLSMIH